MSKEPKESGFVVQTVKTIAKTITIGEKLEKPKVKK